MTTPRSSSPGTEQPWPHGYNSCLHVAISALNHLSSHPRPAGGQEAYNAEHLLQIADEIKRTIAHNVKVAGAGAAQALPSKFSPGVAVEVRNQNNKIDEIVIRRGDVHIEQMSADSWFMGVDASDGSYWQFWFGSKNRKSAVEFRHTETVSAAEQAAWSPVTSTVHGMDGAHQVLRQAKNASDAKLYGTVVTSSNRGGK